MAKGKKSAGERRRAGGPRFRLTPRGAALALLLLLVAGWGIRVVDLDADPPASISWSQGPFTDGAVVIHDARNKVLYGEWIVDYTKDLYLFPLSNLATYPALRIFGINRTSAAFPNTVLAALSLAAMAAGLFFAFGARRALLWTYLAVFNYFLIMFQRIPIAEPAMIFLLSLSFLCFTLGDRWRWAPLAAGFFAVAAPTFGKAHAYYFPLVVGLTYLLTGGSEEGGRGRRTRLAVIGMAAAGAIWLAVLFLPHAADIWSHIAHESYEKHEGGPLGAVRELLQNLVGMGTYTKLYERMSVLAILGFLGFVGLFARGKRIFRDEAPATAFLFLWLGIGWIAIAAVRLPAPRYLSAIVFPLLFMATRPLAALAEGKPIVWKAPKSRAGALAGAFFLLFAFYQPLSSAGTAMLRVLKNSTWGTGIYALFIREERYTELVFFCLLLAAGLMLITLVLLFLRGTEKPFRFPIGRRSGPLLAVVLLGVSLFLNMGNWYYWTVTKTHYLRDASRDLADWMGPGANLMGSYAPTLGLDNHLKTYPYFGGLGEEDVFRKHGVTHVVIVNRGEHGEVKERYPAIFEGWQMVLSYPINCKYSDTMGIYRLPREAGGTTVSDYEPGDFEQAVDLAKERRWEEALALLQSFSRAHPENADGHYLIGFMYNELGRQDEAIRSIEHAIELRPERPYFYFKLGDIYAGLGRTGEARRLLERARRLNPRDEGVKSALEQVSPGAH